MTAKRFRFNGATNCIEYDNESILLDSYGEDIAELLNELNEKYIDEFSLRETLQQDLQRVEEENNKIKSLLLKKVEELNDAYNKSARAGMPTGGIIGELDTLEEICEIMGWIR